MEMNHHEDNQEQQHRSHDNEDDSNRSPRHFSPRSPRDNNGMDTDSRSPRRSTSPSGKGIFSSRNVRPPIEQRQGDWPCDQCGNVSSLSPTNFGSPSKRLYIFLVVFLHVSIPLYNTNSFGFASCHLFILFLSRLTLGVEQNATFVRKPVEMHLPLLRTPTTESVITTAILKEIKIALNVKTIIIETEIAIVTMDVAVMIVDFETIPIITI